MFLSLPWDVEERVPGKQGLKLKNCFNSAQKYKKSKSEFQENKDWNEMMRRYGSHMALSKSEFQENKDWNSTSVVFTTSIKTVEERVPGKQGLKHNFAMRRNFIIASSKSEFQENKDWNYTVPPLAGLAGGVEERVPGKQGLKPGSHSPLVLKIITSKSEFQENKDWNNKSS